MSGSLKTKPPRSQQMPSIRGASEQRQRESLDLAPYAIRNDASKGRIHPEEPHPFRTDFQRDRDRILHSRSFRRLEYKTQVFLNGSGDHLRTRLTHTIEVAALARTIARALLLNEDLTEAIALAHDLGHTPFGHAGERALHKLMQGHGGFDHNLQSLRVVDLLEIKYPSYDGINLSWELRSGLMKHRGEGASLDGAALPPQPSLEAQVADLADDLAYYGHDVDDGIDAGLVKVEMLEDVELWRIASARAAKQGLKQGEERFAAFAVRCIIDMMCGDAIRNSHSLLMKASPASPGAVQSLGSKLIAFSPEMERMTKELREFLYHNLYFHPELSMLNELSLSRMERLFKAYVSDPSFMGETARARVAIDGVHRAAADYIAGMTDRFAFLEYEKVPK